MRSRMRMFVSSVTVLGVLLFAFAVSGISSLAGDLEAAAPPRPPAIEDVRWESRQIDCPLPPPARPLI